MPKPTDTNPCKTHKHPPESVVRMSSGWLRCDACYRAWKETAKTIPRCAPRTVTDGWPERPHNRNITRPG